MNLAVPIDSMQGFWHSALLPGAGIGAKFAAPLWEGGIVSYVELRRTMMGKIAADEVSE